MPQLRWRPISETGQQAMIINEELKRKLIADIEDSCYPLGLLLVNMYV